MNIIYLLLTLFVTQFAYAEVGDCFDFESISTQHYYSPPPHPQIIYPPHQRVYIEPRYPKKYEFFDKDDKKIGSIKPADWGRYIHFDFEGNPIGSIRSDFEYGFSYYDKAEKLIGAVVSKDGKKYFYYDHEGNPIGSINLRSWDRNEYYDMEGNLVGKSKSPCASSKYKFYDKDDNHLFTIKPNDREKEKDTDIFLILWFILTHVHSNQTT